MTQKVFISGIAGFLGSHLADCFSERGWRVCGIDNLFGGFGHVFGVRAEKLNADRALDLIEVEIFLGPLVPAKNSFGGNEFGGEHVRAVFLAELAKNLVRDPGHRREIKRESILKPGQCHI